MNPINRYNLKRMALFKPGTSLFVTTTLFVLITLIRVLSVEKSDNTPNPTTEEILETIKLIDSNDFKVRESATKNYGT